MPNCLQGINLGDARGLLWAKLWTVSTVLASETVQLPASIGTDLAGVVRPGVRLEARYIAPKGLLSEPGYLWITRVRLIGYLRQDNARLRGGVSVLADVYIGTSGS